MQKWQKNFTGDTVEVGADSDGGVTTHGPEVTGNVHMMSGTAKVLPHGNASLQQCVLPHTHPLTVTVQPTTDLLHIITRPMC